MTTEPRDADTADMPHTSTGLISRAAWLDAEVRTYCDRASASNVVPLALESAEIGTGDPFVYLLDQLRAARLVDPSDRPYWQPLTTLPRIEAPRLRPIVPRPEAQRWEPTAQEVGRTRAPLPGRPRRQVRVRRRVTDEIPGDVEFTRAERLFWAAAIIGGPVLLIGGTWLLRLLWAAR